MTRVRTNRQGVLLPAIATIILLGLTPVCIAQGKGGGKGGSGGGSNDGDSTAAYTIVPFAPEGVQSISSGVFGLNDVGDVVGVVDTTSGQLSYHLDLNSGVYTSIPGRVWAVNSFGEIAGTLPGDGETQEGYYLAGVDGAPIPLRPLTGDSYVEVFSINDSGLIAGTSTSFSPLGSRAVVWRPIIDSDGTVTIDGPVALSPLDGDSDSFAVDISNSMGGGHFQILGSSDSRLAVVWTIGLNPNGTLSTPSGAVEVDGVGRGFAINSLGDVCGNVFEPSLPVVKPFDGPAQLLKVVRNTNYGWAMGANDLGSCVGKIETVSKGSVSYRRSAYLWEGANADPVELLKLIDKESGWDELTYADQISNGGIIGGNGYRDGIATGFVLVPAQ